MKQLDSPGRDNCLNTIRLIAAIQVLYGHAIEHLHIAAVPVFGQFINFFNGVPIFFTMSGFLMWNSIGRSSSFSHYSRKRFWRIFPELWVAVVVEIVVLLVLYHQPIDWPKLGLFIFGQATIFQFWTPDFLRGYGCGTPNGALWTITVLIQFYFLAYFIYKLLKDRRLYVWGGVILLSLLIGWFSPNVLSLFPVTISKLYYSSLIPYLWMFLIPLFIAEYKSKIIPYITRYWFIIILVLVVLNLFSCDFVVGKYYFFNTVFLFLGLTGFAYRFPQLNIKTDISYGIYIYHMTIVNALIQFGLFEKRYLVLIVLFATCLLAWISTKTIGKWSLKQKIVK